MRKVAFESRSPYIFLFAVDYRIITSGWKGAPYFRRYAGSWVTVKEKLGGYRRTTQERWIVFSKAAKAALQPQNQCTAAAQQQ